MPCNEGRMRIKKWLLDGLGIPKANGRARHVNMNARALVLPATEAELDAQALGFRFPET